MTGEMGGHREGMQEKTEQVETGMRGEWGV